MLGYGQNLAIGQWKIHSPYSTAISVAEAGDKIYCANKLSVYILDRSDNSTKTIDKTNGLSDIGITKIRYNHDLEILLIAYDNANIDIIENGKVINISDIKRANISGIKTINNIDFRGEYAYLSCSFGLVILDLTKREIKETCYIGQNANFVEINDISFKNNDSIYAATSKGVYIANINNPNLANYESWYKIDYLPYSNHNINTIAYFKDKLFINDDETGTNSDSMYMFDGIKWILFDTIWTIRRTNIEVNRDYLIIVATSFIDVLDSNTKLERRIYSFSSNPQTSHASMDANNDVWISDREKGLVRNFENPWFNELYTPNGPPTTDVCNMTFQNGNLWVAAGGKTDSWDNIYSRRGIYRWDIWGWQNYDGKRISAFDTVFDIIDVVLTPNTYNHVFACSWGRGLVEINDDQLVDIYKENNSSLQNFQNTSNIYWLGVSSGAFDKERNLWLANSSVKNALSVKKTDGTWTSFDLSAYTNKLQTGKLLIDSSDYKWLILPRGNGIVVFSDNGTIDNNSDDKVVKLNTSAGQGKLPSGFIFSMAQDLDKKMWIGTDKGVTVFNNPENIFTGENFDSQQILVEQDGYYQYLLEFEIVNAIAVDGANRKWFGTQNAGVFLMSPDGTKEIAHFTKENSPLLSNNVNSIVINNENGEVFIGTDRGIVSYMGTATFGKPEFTNVSVFPNPVKENYFGPIAIKGMVRDANVKITDISGAIVYEATATGGQAVWDGNNMKGERVSTGVYMVFCSDEKGKQTYVAKILVAN